MFAATANPDRERAAVLALAREPGRSWRELAHALETIGSAVEILEHGVKAERDERLFDFEPVEPDGRINTAHEDVEKWRREGIEVVTVLDADYPVNLRSVHDRPPFLFVRGQLQSDDERSIAVVGTRSASEEGIATAMEMASAAAEAGFVVVSGLAAGIDSAAHRTCLEKGRRTVAVVGTGLRRVYPPENRDLHDRIAGSGAVVSQFWPDQPPQRHTFPMRNAVMSGFALATLVIEASQTSGARMQARLALEHGRPVFLASSLLEHSWAVEYAARPGTFVIDSADQVIETLTRLSDESLALVE